MFTPPAARDSCIPHVNQVLVQSCRVGQSHRGQDALFGALLVTLHIDGQHIVVHLQPDNQLQINFKCRWQSRATGLQARQLPDACAAACACLLVLHRAYMLCYTSGRQCTRTSNLILSCSIWWQHISSSAAVQEPWPQCRSWLLMFLFRSCTLLHCDHIASLPLAHQAHQPAGGSPSHAATAMHAFEVRHRSACTPSADMQLH